MGQLQLGSLSAWWPMILVVIGLNKILQPAASRNLHGGLWMVAVGFWLQACTMNWYGLTFGNSWPLLLVLYGLSIILQAGHPGPRSREVRHERHE